MMKHLKIVMLVAHSRLVAEFCAAKMVSSASLVKNPNCKISGCTWSQKQYGNDVNIGF
jgi:hypothetical protein